VCYIFNAIYPVLLIYFIAQLYETVGILLNMTANIGRFHYYLIVFAALYVVKYVFDIMLSALRSCGLYAKAKYALDRNLAERTSQSPYICYEETETYLKLHRAQECIVSNVPQRIFSRNLDAVSQVVSISGIIFILISFNVWLLPVSIVTIMPFLIVRIIRGQEFYKLRWFQASQRRKMNYLWGLFTDNRVAKEMRAFQFSDYIYDKWWNIKEEVTDEEFEFKKKDSASLLICDLIRITGILMSLLLCLLMTANGFLSIGQFAACIAAFLQVQNMARDILVNVAELNTDVHQLKDYYDFVDIGTMKKTGEKIDRIDTITLENISFQYPNTSNMALELISLKINSGEKVAVVGENGSGKTTLSKLIMNLFEPKSGELKINDIPFELIDKDSFYKLISIVSQNSIQYKMSLKENITISDYKKLPANDTINNILSYVGLEKHNEKQDELLGKDFGGLDFSGGEWQKIAIARALYKNSELVILDEPTSALDPSIENEMLNKFIDITKDKTAIIISHRIGFCKYVDNVIVLKEGRLVGYGPHDDLIKSNEYYKHLYFEQQKWYV